MKTGANKVQMFAVVLVVLALAVFSPLWSMAGLMALLAMHLQQVWRGQQARQRVPVRRQSNGRQQDNTRRD